LSNDTHIGYDIIGDVHGYADKLEGLLRKMDYELIDGTWQHPERKAIFVGDLIDRGPRQVDSVMIAKRMVEAGHAHIVMGNHEFNAIAYATPNPNKPGDFLRTHWGKLGRKNRKQHKAFLTAVGKYSVRHKDLITWFKTIPLWLDLGELRIIHACWDLKSMKGLKSKLGPNHTVTDELMVTMSTKGHQDYLDLEILIKGPEIEMPEGLSYEDKDGIERRKARYAWWNDKAKNMEEAAVISSDFKFKKNRSKSELSEYTIEEGDRRPYTDAVPLFFGHYWCSDKTLKIRSDYTICVDYSAGKGGPLKAYRWDGKTPLSLDGLVSFP
jgi:hypothetical protein